MIGPKLRSLHGIWKSARLNGPARRTSRPCFRSADFVGDNRVIFDIGGNKYRLVVHVAYKYHRVLIKFVGTHSEYDRIDPETV